MEFDAWHRLDQMFALDRLKNDLKDHLANMKSELVELINQDCMLFHMWSIPGFMKA